MAAVVAVCPRASSADPYLSLPAGLGVGGVGPAVVRVREPNPFRDVHQSMPSTRQKRALRQIIRSGATKIGQVAKRVAAAVEPFVSVPSTAYVPAQMHGIVMSGGKTRLSAPESPDAIPTTLAPSIPFLSQTWSLRPEAPVRIPLNLYKDSEWMGNIFVGYTALADAMTMMALLHSKGHQTATVVAAAATTAGLLLALPKSSIRKKLTPFYNRLNPEREQAALRQKEQTRSHFISDLKLAYERRNKRLTLSQREHVLMVLFDQFIGGKRETVLKVERKRPLSTQEQAEYADMKRSMAAAIRSHVPRVDLAAVDTDFAAEISLREFAKNRMPSFLTTPPTSWALAMITAERAARPVPDYHERAQLTYLKEHTVLDDATGRPDWYDHHKRVAPKMVQRALSLAAQRQEVTTPQ